MSSQLMKPLCKRSLINMLMLIALTASSFFLLSCGSGGGDLTQKTDASLDTSNTPTTPADNDSNVDEGPTAKVRLVVKDLKGNPVPDATLTFHAKDTAQAISNGETNPHGEYLFTDIPISRMYAIEIDHRDYAIQVFTTKEHLRENNEHEYTVTLLPMSPVEIISNIEEGATIEPIDSNGTKIIIPPQAFINSLGKTVTGSVEIRVRNLDVSNEEEMAAYPGELKANFGGETVSLFTYGVFFIDVTQNKDSLELAEGKTIRVEIPILRPLHSDGSKVKVGDTIPLWWLDLETGIWQKDNEISVMEAPKTPWGLAGIVELTHILEPFDTLEPLNAEANTSEKSAKKLLNLTARAQGLDCATASTADILAKYGAEENIPSSCLCKIPENAALCDNATVERIKQLHVGRRGAFNVDSVLPQHKMTVRFRNPNEAIEAGSDILAPERMCLGVKVVWGYFKDRDQSKYPGEKEPFCHIAEKTNALGEVDYSLETYSKAHGIMCHGWTIDTGFSQAFAPSTDAPYSIPYPAQNFPTIPYEQRKNLCYVYTLFDSVEDDNTKPWQEQHKKKNTSCFCLDDNKDILNQRFWIEWEFTWGWGTGANPRPAWLLYTDGSKTPRNSRYNNKNELDKWWDENKNGIDGEPEDSDGIPFNKDPECLHITPPTQCTRPSSTEAIDRHPLSDNPKVHYLANTKPKATVVSEKDILSVFQKLITDIPALQPFNKANPTAAEASDEINHIVATELEGRKSRERYPNSYSGDYSNSCIKNAKTNQYGIISGGSFNPNNCDQNSIFNVRDYGPARKHNADFIIEESETAEITISVTDQEYLPSIQLSPSMPDAQGAIRRVYPSQMVRGPHFDFPGNNSPERPLYFGASTISGATVIRPLVIDGSNSLEPKAFLPRMDMPPSLPVNANAALYLQETAKYIGIAKEVWHTYRLETTNGNRTGSATFKFEDFSINKTEDDDGYSTNSTYNNQGSPDTSNGRRKSSDEIKANFIINGKPAIKQGLTVYVNKSASNQQYDLNARMTQPDFTCIPSNTCNPYPYATLAQSNSTQDDERYISTDSDSRNADPHTYIIVSGSNFDGGNTITYNYPANSTTDAEVVAYVKDSRNRPDLNNDGSIRSGLIKVLVNAPPTACDVTAPTQIKNINSSFKISDLNCTDGGTQGDDGRPSGILEYYLVTNTTGDFVSNFRDDGKVTYKPTEPGIRTFTYRTFDSAAYSDTKTVTVITNNPAPTLKAFGKLSIPHHHTNISSIDIKGFFTGANSGAANESYTYNITDKTSHIGGNVSINNNGIATFVPSVLGNGQFTVSVTDTTGGVTSAPLDIAVSYDVYNSAPTLTALGCAANAVTCNISWSSATDANDDPFTIKVNGNNAGVSASGTYTANTGSQAAKDVTYIIQICDHHNECTSYTVKATLINDPPNDFAVNNCTHVAGSSCTASWDTASDPNGNTVTMKLNGIAVGNSASINSSGNYTISACDPWICRDKTVTATLSSPNQAPTLTLNSVGCIGIPSCNMSWSNAQDPDGHPFKITTSVNTNVLSYSAGSVVSSSISVPTTHLTQSHTITICDAPPGGEPSLCNTYSFKTRNYNTVPYGSYGSTVHNCPTYGQPTCRMLFNPGYDPDPEDRTSLVFYFNGTIIPYPSFLDLVIGNYNLKVCDQWGACEEAIGRVW